MSRAPGQVPEVREAVEVLARTPMLLEAWLEGLTEPWLTTREDEGTWSPLEVVAHLLDNEEVLSLIHI